MCCDSHFIHVKLFIRIQHFLQTRVVLLFEDKIYKTVSYSIKNYHNKTLEFDKILLELKDIPPEQNNKILFIKFYDLEDAFCYFAPESVIVLFSSKR